MTAEPRAWRPLLEGAAAEAARAAARAVADAIGPPGDAAGAGPSVAAGDAGLALLFAYLSLEPPGTERDGDVAHAYLARAVGAIESTPLGLGLYGGLPGVAWALEHVQGADDEGDGEDPNAAVDELLLEQLARRPWPGDYDLIEGLVGLGVYALERQPRPSARACLELVVARLEELARPSAIGVTWWTPPEGMLPETAARHPGGYHNLGLAHGVPGVIALCAGAAALGVESARARALVDGAIAWQLAHQRPRDAGDGARFGYFAEEAGEGARTAWCYGDPGVAAALLVAGAALGEPAWTERGLEIAHAAAARPVDRCRVDDPGLCHGAAGLGHLFGRLHQLSGDPALAVAARAWLERALEMRGATGVGGFRAWIPGRGELAAGFVDDRALLTGAAGVALALLAATSEVEPAWDRLLLLSLAPPRA